jgi:hypothetical protein
MKTYSRFAAPAVSVIAICSLGLAACGSSASPSVGERQTATPSVSPPPSASPPSASPPSASPSASPAAPPALTETFTSGRYGFSIMYPAGWVTRPATETWTSSCQYEFCIPDFGTTTGDVIYHPILEGNLWIMVASQQLAGKDGEAWVDEVITELTSADFCDPPIEVVGVDGAQGRQCASWAVAVSAADRGYLILPYVSGDDPAVAVTYDRAWFDEVLATVQLYPEDAVDVASSTSP